MVKHWVPREVAPEQFLNEVRHRHVRSVTICPLDHNVVAVAEYGKPGAIRTTVAGDGRTFIAKLRELDVEVSYDTSDSVSP